MEELSLERDVSRKHNNILFLIGENRPKLKTVFASPSGALAALIDHDLCDTSAGAFIEAWKN